jgi:hypothetical protein
VLARGSPGVEEPPSPIRPSGTQHGCLLEASHGRRDIRTSQCGTGRRLEQSGDTLVGTLGRSSEMPGSPFALFLVVEVTRQRLVHAPPIFLLSAAKRD